MFSTILVPPGARGEPRVGAGDAFRYLSPAPGARLVSPENNVIFRHGHPLDLVSAEQAVVRVHGEESGAHAGTLRLAGDGTTLLFRPHRPFSPGESVTVELGPGVITSGGEPVPTVGFTFEVAPTAPARRAELAARANAWHGEWGPSQAVSPYRWDDDLPVGENSVTVEPLPLTLVTSNDPAPGYLALSPWAAGDPTAHLMLVDNLGTPIFYRKLEKPGFAIDFKRQPDGRLTYYHNVSENRYFALDETYTVVDTIETGNGYVTDGHELLLLPNGHWLVMSYDPQPVAMDEIVPGGDPDAVVVGLIIQELDEDKNVVFQWRSWDHMEITDSVVDLTEPWVDYVHGNALELDHDGNILLCSRHLDEITKISRETGEILWRMGRHAPRNEFTFLDDERGFTHPHDVRRLPNGHLTLFDNGVGRDPEYSRAVEYEIDEEARTARLVWEYRTDPDTYGRIMGSFARGEDGRSLVNWGGNPGAAETVTHSVTEVHPDGSTALDLRFETGYWSYRAYRFPWEPGVLRVAAESIDFGTVAPGETRTLSVPVQNLANVSIEIDSLATSDPSFSAASLLPIAVPAGETVSLSVRFTPGTLGARDAKLYAIAADERTFIGADFRVRGVGGYPISSPVQAARFTGVSPNPFLNSSRIGFDVLRRSHVTLEVYSVRGRRVATILDAELPPGRYQETWAPQGAKPGIYFVRLRSDGVTDTRRAVFLD